VTALRVVEVEVGGQFSSCLRYAVVSLEIDAAKRLLSEVPDRRSTRFSQELEVGVMEIRYWNAPPAQYQLD